MTLGEWLRRNGRSQWWLAGELDVGCTQALVSKWVRGIVLPSRSRQVLIESVTGGAVTSRGLVLRYKRLKAKGKARGEAWRKERGIE